MPFSVRRLLSSAVPLGLIVSGAAASAAVAAPGVSPSHHGDALAPGDSVTITKTVETPPIPPNPDIVFLADTTGSMGSSIANVKANASSILSQIKTAQPTAQFAVAEYKDQGDVYAYRVNTPLTGTNADVVSGINLWSASGGGDTPEAWIGALGRIADGVPPLGFRPDGTRVVVMFGDASSHDPSLGYTQASATAALVAAGIRVIAINVPGADGLNANGNQASEITAATGGALAAADPNQVSAVILSELQNLPATVTHQTVCDDGISATLTPASQTVTSGETTTFTETITLAADAPQGETVSCEVSFLVNGSLPGPEFVQTVDIDVLDVTAPTAACEESTNPGGNVPKAGQVGRSGQNPDGFYRLTSTDNVDADPQVFLRDTGSGHVFGPYADGQRVKYTQAASGPTEEPMAGGSIAHLTGTGDAEVYATDASGNTSDPAACLVPAPPK